MGLSYVRNFGVEKSNGSLIGFVDSDDWIHEDMYSKLYQVMNKYNASLASCFNYTIQMLNGSEEISFRKHSDEIYMDNPLDALLFYMENRDIPVWNKLYKRELFNDIKFPVGKVFEDTYTTHLLIEKAGNAAVTPYPLYNYNVRSSGSITSQMGKSRSSFDNLNGAITRHEYLSKKYNNDRLEKKCRETIFDALVGIAHGLDHLRLTENKQLYDEFVSLCNEVYNKYPYEDCSTNRKLIAWTTALQSGLQHFKISVDMWMQGGK